MKQVRCPVCYHGFQLHLFCHKDVAVYQCPPCDTIYIYPLPSSCLVEELYNDSYEGATTGYFSKVTSKLRRCRRRMKTLVSWVKSPKRFLDVGCNGGFGVEAARENGLEAVGIDLDAVSLAYAKKNYPRGEYYHSPVERLPVSIEPFDIIYSSEVIEHVPNPHPFVEAISRLLKPGGIFYVTTPDIHHWRVPKNITGWETFCPPTHCLYYSRKSLRMLLERYGIKVQKTFIAFKPGIKMIARKL